MSNPPIQTPGQRSILDHAPMFRPPSSTSRSSAGSSSGSKSKRSSLPSIGSQGVEGRKRSHGSHSVEPKKKGRKSFHGVHVERRGSRLALGGDGNEDEGDDGGRDEAGPSRSAFPSQTRPESSHRNSLPHVDRESVNALAGPSQSAHRPRGEQSTPHQSSGHRNADAGPSTSTSMQSGSKPSRHSSDKHDTPHQHNSHKRPRPTISPAGAMDQPRHRRFGGPSIPHSPGSVASPSAVRPTKRPRLAVSGSTPAVPSRLSLGGAVGWKADEPIELVSSDDEQGQRDHSGAMDDPVETRIPRHPAKSTYPTSYPPRSAVPQSDSLHGSVPILEPPSTRISIVQGPSHAALAVAPPPSATPITQPHRIPIQPHSPSLISHSLNPHPSQPVNPVRPAPSIHTRPPASPARPLQRTTSSSHAPASQTLPPPKASIAAASPPQPRLDDLLSKWNAVEASRSQTQAERTSRDTSQADGVDVFSAEYVRPEAITASEQEHAERQRTEDDEEAVGMLMTPTGARDPSAINDNPQVPPNSQSISAESLAQQAKDLLELLTSQPPAQTPSSKAKVPAPSAPSTLLPALSPAPQLPSPPDLIVMLQSSLEAAQARLAAEAEQERRDREVEVEELRKAAEEREDARRQAASQEMEKEEFLEESELVVENAAEVALACARRRRRDAINETFALMREEERALEFIRENEQKEAEAEKARIQAAEEERARQLQRDREAAAAKARAKAEADKKAAGLESLRLQKVESDRLAKVAADKAAKAAKELEDRAAAAQRQKEEDARAQSEKEAADRLAAAEKQRRDDAQAKTEKEEAGRAVQKQQHEEANKAENFRLENLAVNQQREEAARKERRPRKSGEDQEAAKVAAGAKAWLAADNAERQRIADEAAKLVADNKAREEKEDKARADRFAEFKLRQEKEREAAKAEAELAPFRISERARVAREAEGKRREEEEKRREEADLQRALKLSEQEAAARAADQEKEKGKEKAKETPIVQAPSQEEINRRIFLEEEARRQEESRKRAEAEAQQQAAADRRNAEVKNAVQALIETQYWSLHDTDGGGRWTEAGARMAWVKAFEFIGACRAAEMDKWEQLRSLEAFTQIVHTRHVTVIETRIPAGPARAAALASAPHNSYVYAQNRRAAESADQRAVRVAAERAAMGGSTWQNGPKAAIDDLAIAIATRERDALVRRRAAASEEERALLAAVRVRRAPAPVPQHQMPLAPSGAQAPVNNPPTASSSSAIAATVNPTFSGSFPHVWSFGSAAAIAIPSGPQLSSSATSWSAIDPRLRTDVHAGQSQAGPSRAHYQPVSAHPSTTFQANSRVAVPYAGPTQASSQPLLPRPAASALPIALPSRTRPTAARPPVEAAPPSASTSTPKSSTSAPVPSTLTVDSDIPHTPATHDSRTHKPSSWAAVTSSASPVVTNNPESSHTLQTALNPLGAQSDQTPREGVTIPRPVVSAPVTAAQSATAESASSRISPKAITRSQEDDQPIPHFRPRKRRIETISDDEDDAMPGRSAAAEQARGFKRQPSVMSAGSLAVETASMSNGDKTKESKRKAKLAALAKQKREADGVILVSSGDDADADGEDDDDIVILPSQSQRIRRGGETGKGKERAAPGSVQDKAEQEGVLDQGQVSNAVNSPLQPSQRTNLAPSQPQSQPETKTRSSTQSSELGVRPRVSVIPPTQSSHSRSQENAVLPNQAQGAIGEVTSKAPSATTSTRPTHLQPRAQNRPSWRTSTPSPQKPPRSAAPAPSQSLSTPLQSSQDIARLLARQNSANGGADTTGERLRRVIEYTGRLGGPSQVVNPNPGPPSEATSTSDTPPRAQSPSAISRPESTDAREPDSDAVAPTDVSFRTATSVTAVARDPAVGKGKAVLPDQLEPGQSALLSRTVNGLLTPFSSTNQLSDGPNPVVSIHDATSENEIASEGPGPSRRGSPIPAGLSRTRSGASSAITGPDGDGAESSAMARRRSHRNRRPVNYGFGTTADIVLGDEFEALVLQGAANGVSTKGRRRPDANAVPGPENSGLRPKRIRRPSPAKAGPSQPLPVPATVAATAEVEDSHDILRKFGCICPTMTGRKDNKWTKWSTSIVPGTLRDLMWELDKLFPGGDRQRGPMRRMDEEVVWGDMRHISDKRRFLSCCWNRWTLERGAIRGDNPAAHLQGFVDKYGELLRFAGLDKEVSDCFHTLSKHGLVPIDVLLDACRYWERHMRYYRQVKAIPHPNDDHCSDAETHVRNKSIRLKEFERGGRDYAEVQERRQARAEGRAPKLPKEKYVFGMDDEEDVVEVL